MQGSTQQYRSDIDNCCAGKIQLVSHSTTLVSYSPLPNTVISPSEVLLNFGIFVAIVVCGKLSRHSDLAAFRIRTIPLHTFLCRSCQLFSVFDLVENQWFFFVLTPLTHKLANHE